jgi:PKD repeat protein
MNAAQTKYIQTVLPAAQKVASKTGLAPELVAAWWSWETAFGANGTSKVNNHSGIKAASSGKDFVSGQYAGYNSEESYVADYVRTITARDYRGYGAIIDASKSNPKNYAAVTAAHNASKWSEADYNVSTIVARAQEIAKMIGVGVGGGTVPKPQAVAACPHCGQSVQLSLSRS